MYRYGLETSTRTETDSVKIYFQRKINSSNECRSPEPVWTAPFTNTWLGRPTEVFSRVSNYHSSHIITCGHGDSLEFKFTSPESDTLLYQVWYRNSRAVFLILTFRIQVLGSIMLILSAAIMTLP